MENFIKFIFFGFLSQLVYVLYTIGQFYKMPQNIINFFNIEKTEDKDFIYQYNSYNKLILSYILIGGCQTLLVMNAVKAGSTFISLMNIQLLFIILSHFITHYINYFYIKDSKFDEIDVISSLILLIGFSFTKIGQKLVDTSS